MRIYQQSTKHILALFYKKPNTKNELMIDGVNKQTGLPDTIRVLNPSDEVIITALLQQAAKGDMDAIKEVFNIVDGPVS